MLCGVFRTPQEWKNKKGDQHGHESERVPDLQTQ